MGIVCPTEAGAVLGTAGGVETGAVKAIGQGGRSGGWAMGGEVLPEDRIFGEERDGKQ